jgi:predicted DNA-binding protein YlxM (UPF0122 family)
MIPDESTPIKNMILTEIIAQGRLTYDEVRIASFVMRWSWGFEDKANNRRQDWTKDFSVSEIAKEIKIHRGTCSETISKMVNEGKLLRDGNKFQFNEHYESWNVSEKATRLSEKPTRQHMSEIPTQLSEIPTPLSEKPTPSVGNTDTPDIPQTIMKKDLEGENALHKETIKETKDKETIKKSTNQKITFNTETLKFENIKKEMLDKWIEAYPNCNVSLELKKMEAWLAANPDRLKKNYEKFIVNWLARAKGEKANERYIGITGNKEFTGANNASAGEW